MYALLHHGLLNTPLAILSRPVAGIRQSTLIVTLPGSPKAVKEGILAISVVLPHALHLVSDLPHQHHKAIRGACSGNC